MQTTSPHYLGNKTRWLKLPRHSLQWTHISTKDPNCKLDVIDYLSNVCCTCITESLLYNHTNSSSLLLQDNSLTLSKLQNCWFKRGQPGKMMGVRRNFSESRSHSHTRISATINMLMMARCLHRVGQRLEARWHTTNDRHRSTTAPRRRDVFQGVGVSAFRASVYNQQNSPLLHWL